MESLRKRRSVATGAELAAQTKTSLRTLYRDIQALREQGVTIDGEAGTGYRMIPGWVLPPMMFSEDELEALVLGARWVRERTDPVLSRAAAQALSRIEAVLPLDLRSTLEHSALLVGPSNAPAGNDLDLVAVRRAMKERRRTRLVYRDGTNRETQRVIWPVSLAFFESTRVLAGWCELRQDFRHFRLDRIVTWEVLEPRYPGSRAQLLSRWKDSLGFDPT